MWIVCDGVYQAILTPFAVPVHAVMPPSVLGALRLLRGALVLGFVLAFALLSLFLVRLVLANLLVVNGKDLAL